MYSMNSNIAFASSLSYNIFKCKMSTKYIIILVKWPFSPVLWNCGTDHNPPCPDASFKSWPTTIDVMWFRVLFDHQVYVHHCYRRAARRLAVNVIRFVCTSASPSPLPRSHIPHTENIGNRIKALCRSYWCQKTGDRQTPARTCHGQPQASQSIANTHSNIYIFDGGIRDPDALAGRAICVHIWV